jgi:outer membrane protein TolC
VFSDAQLIAFVQEALENNRSLRAAIESVRQSEMALQQVRSRLLPADRRIAGARKRRRSG